MTQNTDTPTITRRTDRYPHVKRDDPSPLWPPPSLGILLMLIALAICAGVVAGRLP